MGCLIEYEGILSLPLVVVAALLSTSFDVLSKPPLLAPEGGKCELIGTFSLITQGLLGVLCLSSLIAKRAYEYPMRRTWPVWMFDVSKQLIGALGVHVFNVLLSILKTRDDDGMMLRSGTNGPNPGDEVDDDPCDWYFLNIVLDCTIGVCVLYVVFKYVNLFCKNYLKMTNIESGEYGGDLNRPSFRAYFKQLAIYFISLMITKFILYGLVECFEQELIWLTHNIILIWLTPYPDEFEIFIVMFVVPIVMNCLQLILIDNFIQNQFTHNINEMLHDETDSVVAKEIEQIMSGQKRASHGSVDSQNPAFVRHKTYGSTDV